MDATLKALGELLLQAVPTIFFFLFLAWFLKRVYFRPIAAILKERNESTERVRDLARHAGEAADKRQSEYERALEIARRQLYDEFEALRVQWTKEQSEAVAAARTQAEADIAAAKTQIAGEADQAQQQLDSQVDRLSGSIVNAVVGRAA